MRGYWCKNCNKFVVMKKDYTIAKVILSIYLFAILIGLVAFFPWGGLGVFLIGGWMILEAGGLSAQHFCSICRSKVRKKRIPKTQLKMI
ncbi:hypothetical protein LCGC14_2319880 [marine sediment metagenome]|uniref:Uncharacterized protein n=1 Tax=marine sediment metagenome TaxID=412755 RepID=A0A0F9D5M7_9ZZZZ